MPQTEPRWIGRSRKQQPLGHAAAGANSVTQPKRRIAAEVPERPALALDVQPMGELQGTGFTDRQWLIQRDSQFIQVTELLYRIAEQANGERTLEEIAARVTEATDWLVSADNVRQLVQTKLIPLGLVAAADGSVALRSEDRPRSPLQVNMRMRMFSPRLIDPITKVLQILYAPPVLVPVLLVVAIAQAWVYLVHGVSASFDAAVYTPWLLLVLLPIAAVSGVFHEFGHAAALRYGGGRVRGMGVGLYLVYPTLYTDVTDGYRLGRWARVRTDLGGFYFDSIFALGLTALYVLSGEKVLIVAVVMIGWNFLYQSLPYVRLDGYWALTDLTGIPDFFSQIGPFLSSVLPVPGPRGSKLPNLKPWVRVAFASYIILVIPTLALLLLLLVTFLPSRVATIWDSFLNQTREFSSAQSHGDILGLMTSVVSMLLLAVVMLAIVYLLYSLSWRPIKAVWNWSKPTLARRIAGALGGAAVIAVVGFIWVPQLPYTVWAWTVPAGPAGTQTFEVTERSHVPPPLSYPQIPPAGGKHAPFWQNCGFYDAPILNETAVHSMEHGAVWITYRPDLPVEQLDSLRGLAHRQSHVLVSLFPDLPAPVVASAWGKQLRLDSAEDPRLQEFLRAFRLGPQAPEAGGPCSGGMGQPT